MFKLVGVGHSAMFTDKAGKLRIVYHAHKDKDNIHPRAMYIGEVSFDKSSRAHILRIVGLLSDFTDYTL